MQSFGARLSEVVARRGPLCVGIDPHASLLRAWGLPDSPQGLGTFAHTVVEALADRVAVLKPQSAFFERFGSAGIAVLESVIRQSHEAGAVVLLDVKRGDVGTTMHAYADAYLHPDAALRSDAITVSPYLGFGSLTPVFDLAAAHGGGAFVLTLTSNPEGPAVQHARAADGRTVAQTVIDAVSGLNAGAEPLGSVGLVVGATVGETAHDLSRLHGPVLAPGLGAQGARAQDLRIFADLDGLVLPAYSREVLGRGPAVADLREAAARAGEECQQVLGYSMR
jgi:orotidine-5'-phosphate decarboxylase